MKYKKIVVLRGLMNIERNVFSNSFPAFGNSTFDWPCASDDGLPTLVSSRNHEQLSG